MSESLSQLLSERNCLLADGATGTNLFAMGLQTGDCPEHWNREHPDRVATSYRSFVEAGSDLLLTNSFGGNRCRLKLHRSENAVDELNERAAAIAREEVAKADRTLLVAGSMGPTGEILAPLGELQIEAATEVFAEQAKALARGGVDLLWLETLSSMEETQAAIAGAAQTGLPIVCTMSFDTNGRSMMGVTPADLAAFAANKAVPLAAFGANCGVGPSELVLTILNMAASSTPDAVIVAKGNCGIPEYINGAICYDGTPQLMAAYARLAVDAGARIIGGCCGTSPQHVAAMRRALDGYQPGEKPTLTQIVEALGEVSNGARAQYHGDYDPAAGSASQAPARRRSRVR